MSFRDRHLAVILGCCTVLVAVASPAAAQVDPFYARLLEDGSRELSLEHYQEAVGDLRLACFGLLDQPVVLIQGLVLLAVAQEGASDSAGLRRTLDRVLEVEERFGVYDEASLPQAMKPRFEKLLVTLTAESRVAAIPAFSQLVEREQPQPTEQVGEASDPEPQVDPAASTSDPSQGEGRVMGRRLLRLVRRWLKAGVVEEKEFADPERVVESASDLAEIEDHLQRVQEIADSYPELTEASLLAGRLAYRASRWEIAVRYLEKCEGLEENPSLQFYLAVALYESGDPVQAAETLRQAMPGLEPTSFVKSYERKILGADGVGESG